MKTQIKQITASILLCCGITAYSASVFASDNNGKNKNETKPAKTPVELSNPNSGSNSYIWASCPLQNSCTKTAGADAGPDKTYSSGACCVPPTLGGTTAQGCATGTQNCSSCQITYSWLPTTGLSNPNICHPTATPASTTTYTLTVKYTCGQINCHGTIYDCCLDGCTGTCGSSPHCSGTRMITDQVTVTVNSFDCCRLKNPSKRPEINDAKTKVYPNPTPGIFTVELSEENPNTVIHIYSMAGDAVWAKRVITSGKQIIDISKESKGVYYLEVKNNEKVLLYKKIVVQ